MLVLGVALGSEQGCLFGDGDGGDGRGAGRRRAVVRLRVRMQMLVLTVGWWRPCDAVPLPARFLALRGGGGGGREVFALSDEARCRRAYAVRHHDAAAAARAGAHARAYYRAHLAHRFLTRPPD